MLGIPSNFRESPLEAAVSRRIKLVMESSAGRGKDVGTFGGVDARKRSRG